MEMLRPHGETTTALDFIGIGIGPANLSLAALAEPLQNLRFRCFDRKPGFHWHRGLLIPGARIQVSWLKDLVSLVDPTNRFSFVNFLAAHKRLYSFIAADFEQVSRAEYEQYYNWVAKAIPALSCTYRTGSAGARHSTDGFCGHR